MTTILFIILKFSDSLILSWWWIILALILDFIVMGEYNNFRQRINELESEIEEIKNELPENNYYDDDEFNNY